MEKTLNKLCAEFEIDKCIVLSSRRDLPTVKKRAAIAKRLREAGLSLPKIGKLLNRHHTSIMNLLKKY